MYFQAQEPKDEAAGATEMSTNHVEREVLLL